MPRQAWPTASCSLALEPGTCLHRPNQNSLAQHRILHARGERHCKVFTSGGLGRSKTLTVSCKMRTSSGTLFTSSHSKDSSSVPTMYTMLQSEWQISVMESAATQSKAEGDASNAVSWDAELRAHSTHSCMLRDAPACLAHQCSPVRPLKSVMMPFHHLLSCSSHTQLSAIGKPRALTATAGNLHSMRAAEPLAHESLAHITASMLQDCEGDSGTQERSRLPRSGPLCARPGGSGP